MKPVYQSITDEGKGDCFSACLASLLEIPLESVPKFRAENPKPGEMMKAARSWLVENFGLSLITLQMEPEEFWTGEGAGTDIRIIGALKETPCIAGGKSPNLENCQHAVVGFLGENDNFVMTHDPNPSGKGIVGNPLHLYFFVPMNPAKIK